jgi:hypothetical protein
MQLYTGRGGGGVLSGCFIFQFQIHNIHQYLGLVFLIFKFEKFYCAIIKKSQRNKYKIRIYVESLILQGQ